MGYFLVFLTGHDDTEVQLITEEAQNSGMIVLPLYSGLTRADQVSLPVCFTFGWGAVFFGSFVTGPNDRSIRRWDRTEEPIFLVVRKVLQLVHFYIEEMKFLTTFTFQWAGISFQFSNSRIRISSLVFFN